MAPKGISRIIDGDGHVIEDMQAIIKYLPAEWQNNNTTRILGVFPGLDHMHNFIARNPPGAFVSQGAEGWRKFADQLGLDAAVLYPTAGLAYGKMIDIEYAIGTAQAYNNWLSDAYCRKDSRLKGIGLIPMQDPAAACAELRRMVDELGFVGAFLPSTGLKSHLGDKIYWPVYAEADRLGCCLGVHGGAHSGLGFDQMNVFSVSHALGHPQGIAIAFGSLAMNGIFERFPNARFGFMEGGVGWFIMAMERLEGSYNAFVPHDPRGELLRLRDGESVSEYLVRQIKAGRVFVGVEGDEPALGWAVRKYGNEAFVFSSDYPHEVNLDTCQHEIEELLENGDLSKDDKDAIFFRNSERFYGLNAAPAAAKPGSAPRQARDAAPARA